MLSVLITNIVICLIYFTIGVLCFRVIVSKNVNSVICTKRTQQILMVLLAICYGFQMASGIIYYVKNKHSFELVLFIVQLAFIIITQISVLIYTYFVNARLHSILIEFHEFLVSYRQTPRSRIFKKHMPVGQLMPV